MSMRYTDRLDLRRTLTDVQGAALASIAARAAEMPQAGPLATERMRGRTFSVLAEAGLITLSGPHARWELTTLGERVLAAYARHGQSARVLAQSSRAKRLEAVRRFLHERLCLPERPCTACAGQAGPAAELPYRDAARAVLGAYVAEVPYYVFWVESVHSLLCPDEQGGEGCRIEPRSRHLREFADSEAVTALRTCIETAG